MPDEPESALLRLLREMRREQTVRHEQVVDRLDRVEQRLSREVTDLRAELVGRTAGMRDANARLDELEVRP